MRHFVASGSGMYSNQHARCQCAVGDDRACVVQLLVILTLISAAFAAIRARIVHNVRACSSCHGYGISRCATAEATLLLALWCCSGSASAKTDTLWECMQLF